MMSISTRPRSSGSLPALVAMLAAIVTAFPALAQDPTGNETTFTGTVASSTRSTLVVRNANGQHQLFVFERDTVKPASLPAGSRVRVVSTPGDEVGVRIARDVAILQSGQGAASRAEASATDNPNAEVSPVVPRELRAVERDIERQARRFQVGVQAGVALDPELVLIGVQSQVGPFFHPDLHFRPSVEFAYGEVTALFALNLEAIYRLPINSRQGRWSAYAGAGPGFNFLHQNFEKDSGGKRIDFGEFHSDTGLNILGGVRFRRGTLFVLKTTVYSAPAPTLRLIFGYNF
jgi:hypothetical protein